MRAFLCRLVRIIVDISILAGIAGYVTLAAYTYSIDISVPRTVHNMWVEPSAVRPGEIMEVKVSVTVHRICKTTVQRWIVRSGNQESIWHGVSPGIIGTIGKNLGTIRVPVPVDIHAGDYYYKSIVYDVCDGKTYTTNSPFVYFQVVEREK